jgi:channel protein, hemolysin III family
MKLRDPVSGLTHLFGMFLSIAGLVLLVVYAALTGTAWHIVSFSIFGASLILLYAASAFYHLLPVPEKWQKILQRIDHMMIYVLIAGTYTPICLVPLRGAWGWSLFGVIWGCAVLGVVAQSFNKAPRWLYTLIYVIMGWLVVVAFWPLIQQVQFHGIVWLVTGGIFYSIGAVIYATKWPFKDAKWFGFHEIFHLFVIAGSFCHFWLMFKYLMKL